MDEDLIILLFCFVLYWIALFVFTLKSENRKKTFLINFGIHLLYSSYFIYGLLYQSQGGAGLVWWFYLIVVIGLHCVINLISLLVLLFRKTPKYTLSETQQEMEDLFTMFHDFEIVLLTHKNDLLTLTIIIPWGQLWDDLDYKIKVELKGCYFMDCAYTEIVNTPENLAKNWVDRLSVNKSTNDPEVISTLGLEVQRHNFYPPNKYEFLCNSSGNYAGGQLTFTADGYSIFNKNGEPIDLRQMKSWSTEWWSKIGN